MNQILQVNNKKNHNELKHKKDIVLFVVILLIVFCVGVGGYILFENITSGNIKLPIFTDVPPIPEETTKITLTQTDRNKLIISVESEVGISKIICDVNGERSQLIELEGETFIEKTLEMPIGGNIVYVSVTDINDKEVAKEEEFTVEPPKPTIELSVVGNDIKMTILSEVELAQITYKWNTDNEKKENMITYENKFEFEKKLEIPIGKNTLTIVAIDINGERTEKVQEIKGVTKATTKTEVIGEYLHFTVTGKENIEKVEFVFNGQKFLMNKQTFGNTKKVHYRVKLIEGKNYLTITSTTQSGGIDVTSWEEEYTK